VIVSTRAVRSFSTVSKSKLLLELLPKPPFEVVVSQEQAAGFKAWVGGGSHPRMLKIRPKMYIHRHSCAAK